MGCNATKSSAVEQPTSRLSQVSSALDSSIRRVSSVVGSPSRRDSMDGDMYTRDLSQAPMKLLRADMFLGRSREQIPRSDEILVDSVNYVELSDIADRSNYFIVVVSHRWSDWEKQMPSPDNCNGDKFQLLRQAIQVLQEKVREHNQKIEVLVWIDYFCIDQDNPDQKREGIKCLPAYVANSDALLTPFYLSSKVNLESEMQQNSSDENAIPGIGGPTTDTNEPDEYSGPLDKLWPWSTKYKVLGNHEEGYFGRSWCRLELFLGLNAPLPEGGFNYFEKKAIKKNKVADVARTGRPHFFFGDKDIDGEKLLILPDLGRKLSPLKGAVTYEEDRDLIHRLASQRSASPLTSSKYEGEKMFSFTPIKHGEGTMTFVDGAEYTGGWKNGMRSGQGKQIYPNGDMYDGPWLKDNKHGDKGKFVWADGSMYVGPFNNDKRHGDGKLYKFEGVFETDPKKDEGYKYEDKKLYRLCYDGEWEDGRKHGEGVLYLENGDKYEGLFEDDLKHGEGEYSWADGRRYIGHWVAGKKHGTGKMLWPEKDGKTGKKYAMRRYCGKFEKGKRSGEGELIYANGDLYCGRFSKNMKHGNGIFIWGYYKDGSGNVNLSFIDKEFGNEADSNEAKEILRWQTVAEIQKKLERENKLIERFEGTYQNDKQYDGTFYMKGGGRFIGKYDKDDFKKRSGTLIDAGQDTELGDRYIGKFVRKPHDPFTKNGKGEQWKYLGFRVEEEYQQKIQHEDSSLSSEPRWKIVQQEQHPFPKEKGLRRHEKIQNLRTEKRDIKSPRNEAKSTAKKKGQKKGRGKVIEVEEEIIARDVDVDLRDVHVWSIREEVWEDGEQKFP